MWRNLLIFAIAAFLSVTAINALCWIFDSFDSIWTINKTFNILWLIWACYCGYEYSKEKKSKY